MGIRGQANSDRSRTTWTPEMDRYFIDLMLEQVRKGNRIDDRLFSKLAWDHMTSVFYAKFKLQNEKDILKNRHKTLRNLFRAVQNLLVQKGFSWDDTRKMVTADNKIWDDYIKAHPDARSFRVKTIPYFKDLCIIYRSAAVEGHTDLFNQDPDVDRNRGRSETAKSSEGLESPATIVDDSEPGDDLLESSSHSGDNTAKAVTPLNFCVGGVVTEALHEISIDEDYGSSMSKASDDTTPQPAADTGLRINTRSRTYWQPQMDRYFLDLMLEHAQKGDQVDGLFCKQAWMEMIESFNARFGFNYDVEILKNRYKTMRRQYSAVKNLLDLDGFSWDETRQMVTADDSVWQEYTKVRTDARHYMAKPFPYYEDLCIICRELSNEGRGAFSGHKSDRQNVQVKFAGSLKGLRYPEASVSSDDQVGDVQESSRVGFRINGCNRKNKRNLENPPDSSNSKRARGNDEGIASVLREMATAVSCLADKKKDDEALNSISMENVVHAVQALTDIDEDLVLDACDLLEDEKKAKTFLALDVKLRKKWLIRKLRP